MARKAKVAEANEGKSRFHQPTAEGPVSAEPPPRRWLYADKHLVPGDEDPLGFGAYADALALLIDWKDTSTPLTIAINKRPWGSGKTSLAKMTEAHLADRHDWDAPHVICWFDAWANDDAPHLGAAFSGCRRRRKHASPVVGAFRNAAAVCDVVTRAALVPAAVVRRPGARAGCLTVFWPTGGSLLAPLLHPGATVSDMAHGTAATRLAWPLLAVAVVALAQKLLPSVQGVARWIDNPRSEAARGSMQDANRQLRHLIAQALRGKRRLIIFVDNLERCTEPASSRRGV